MEKDWVKIKTYTNAIQSEIVKQMLLENEVNAVVLNKQDSSYLFGKIELYVNVNDVEKANALIDELNPEEN
ncbi:Uncharacterised protein [Sphingobacterium spiritivorum]|uniref:DUF2007 domain-containing protein n=1 Tax=Sphingobacterium spiritivorum TaxID=258 RepID=A0A380C9H7_SPHSI|nr:DUF2007 domain-containing protein [Sphingobacterium spiritivorum]SUJ15662.1 Uncharacterised protein [Sphingobacterium spiritivorum]